MTDQIDFVTYKLNFMDCPDTGDQTCIGYTVRLWRKGEIVDDIIAGNSRFEASATTFDKDSSLEEAAILQLAEYSALDASKAYSTPAPARTEDDDYSA